MKQSAYTEILHQAVEREAEAYTFYRDAATKVGESGLRTVFENLAKDELKHKVLLESFLAAPDRLHFEEGHDYGVSETVEEKMLSAEMNFADAIALAMKKEEAAVVMYRAFAEASRDAEQQALFSELARMELGHKANLEDIFVNASMVEVW